MSHRHCASQEELLGWWLDELQANDDARLDEHLFACARCTARATWLAELGEGIRRAVRSGDFGFVVPARFISRIREQGLVVREYTLAPGGSVNCTIASGDDLVVANLSAPLQDVNRLDLLIEDSVLGKVRVEDVPYDGVAGGLSVVPSASFLRTLKHAQQRMQLVSVEGGSERVIANYTFNHYPS